MFVSDLSIRRPVLATVTSLLLIVLGVFAFTRLPLRELPDIDPPVVSISTSYTGASAAVVETRITQVLEDAVSGIEGVDLLTSNSRNGRSNINIEFSTQRDIESAANDVRDAVSRAIDNLPEDVDTPQVAQGRLGFRSDPVGQPDQPGVRHAGADRLRRPLPGRSAVEHRRRLAGQPGRRADLRDARSGRARPRWRRAA